MMNESFMQQTVKSQFDVNESVNQLHFAFCGIPTILTFGFELRQIPTNYYVS